VEEKRQIEEHRPQGGIPQNVLAVVFRLATWRNILILWALLVFYNLLILAPAYARIEALSGGVRALDFLIAYRPEKAFDMIVAYGEEGRRYYASIALSLDTIFPVLSALAFGLTIARVYGGAFSREGVLHRALFVPVGAMVADLLENVGIVTMLLSYPSRSLVIALLTSSFSTVKWTAVAAESLLVVIGVVAWALNVVLGRDNERGSEDTENQA
jgi:hypothetical protein